jgi:hypothetical protein
MPAKNLESLRKRLNRIVKEEICACLRAGKTDLETVACRVETRASVLIEQLAPKLAAAEVREIVQRFLKKTEVGPDPKEEPDVAQQMEFAGMDEFRGIPPNVTYEDEPGHVAYVCYLDTKQLERAAALRLLAKSIEADQQTYFAMKAGNDFADTLVRIYGDLPLSELYRLYRADRGRRAAGI